jgi:diguanylate cyclase (GGDEF)-like protein
MGAVEIVPDPTVASAALAMSPGALAMIIASAALAVLGMSLVSALAGSARQQLIAASQAEIGRQVERLSAALTNMSQGLSMFDRDQRLVVSNRQYAEVYGIAPDRIRPGMSLREILQERVAAGSYYGDPVTHVERRIVAARDSKRSDTIVELRNGHAIHVVRQPLKDGGWLATHEDVTERRQMEAKVAHMAMHDALTGLPNRVLFRKKLQEALLKIPRGQRIALHCLDLDYFKSVNDTLGHPIGDALLRSVTERLLQCICAEDLVSRQGGDEFAIIQHVEDAHADATALAQRIIDKLSVPYDIDAHQLIIGVSIGVAIAPDDGLEPDELLKNGDLALYRAKADGRGIYRFFKAEMDLRLQARRRLELDLRKALVAGEFELHYQPLINLHSNRITGCEALIRWRHGEKGVVGPEDFISVLEETALIVPVGEWILQEACREAASWPDRIKVAVNLSPVQFRSSNLVPAVANALAQAGLPANRLELEITESVLMQDCESTLATLHQLKELGVMMAMDDFGTGYSSLSYLQKFPFDKIKIDRSFINNLTYAKDSAAIVRAVATLGASLGMATTAEGVENIEQLDQLRAEGCTEVQGYLFSPPCPAHELVRVLSEPRDVMAAA